MTVLIPALAVLPDAVPSGTLLDGELVARTVPRTTVRPAAPVMQT